MAKRRHSLPILLPTQQVERSDEGWNGMSAEKGRPQPGTSDFPSCASELELQRELNLARAGGSIGAADLRCGLTEARGAESPIRLAKGCVVENIVELRAELELEAFRDRRLFAQYDIPVVESGSVEVVSAEVAIAAKRSKRERTLQRPGLGFVGARGDGRIANEVEARVNARMGGVERPEQLIGQAGRERGNTGNLPAFENPAGESITEAG